MLDRYWKPMIEEYEKTGIKAYTRRDKAAGIILDVRRTGTEYHPWIWTVANADPEQTLTGKSPGAHSGKVAAFLAYREMIGCPASRKPGRPRGTFKVRAETAP